jgi:molybdopterin-guanine dinucleotide biosynthesis protein A
MISAICPAVGGAAESRAITIERTSLPDFTSARTTDFVTGTADAVDLAVSADVANAGIATSSIEQYFINLTGIARITQSFDGNIRSVLGSGEMDDRPSGWVLVGGRSIRMGRDKAWVEIDGRPLALVAAAALERSCASVSLVGDPVRYGALGMPVIADRFAGSGPLSGIEAALAATCSDWNVIVACDMPSLDAQLLDSLIASAADDGVVPRYPDGSVEPLCAVYHRRCHRAAEEALERGMRRLTDFLAQLTIRYFPVTDDQAFRNLNTPADVERYRSG